MRLTQRYTKRVSVPRPVRVSEQVHTFIRTASLQFPVYNNTLGIVNYANEPTSGVFKLSDLPNYTDFTNLFDQYRITNVAMRFMCAFNEATLSTGPTATIPNLISVLDHDDATPLTLRSGYLQYGSFKERRLDKELKISVKPRLATAVYNGAFTGYAESDNSWVDCDSPAVEYYGVKWGISFPVVAVANTAVGYITVDTQVTLECRTTR